MRSSRDRSARRRAVVASLSAVGAALAAGGEARAGITVVNVNENIGFAPGDITTTGTITLPGGVGFKVTGQSFGPGSSGTGFQRIRILPVGGIGDFIANVVNNTALTRFDGLEGLRVGPGATFQITTRKFPGGTSFIANHGGAGLVSAVVDVASSKGYSLGGFTDKYILFSFVDAGQRDYGYIYGSETSDSYGSLSFDFKAYAYDDTGAPLPAGAGMAPEPSTAMMTSVMGALILGAAGIRRWKTAKAAAAAGTATS